MSGALGRGLVAAWGGRQTGRQSPPAATWRAQLRELTRSSRGRSALREAGVSPRSINAWQAHDRRANRASQTKITSAYAQWFSTRRAMGQPSALPTDTVHTIYGQVVIGDDDRERINGFRIGDNSLGDWRRIRDAWRRSHADPAGKPPDDLIGAQTWDDLIGHLFIADVIMDDLGMDISNASTPAFPGPSYTVTLE